MRLFILFFATTYLAAQATEPTFTPIGLRVNSAFVGQSFEFEPIGYKSGTTVDIELLAKDLIAIDQEASTVTVFADDSGKDLLKLSDGNGPAALGSFPKINDTGTAGLFDVSSPASPGKSARFVSLAGKLAIKTAITRGRSVIQQVRLVNGTKLAWGSKQFVVNRVSNEGALIVELKTEDPVDNLAEISVAHPSGKKIVAKNRMSSTLEIAGKPFHTLAYEIETTSDTFDVTIEFWTDMKTLLVPFAVKIGVGL